MLPRRHLPSFLLACASLVASTLAHAQTPVRIVTGFPPGGGVDAVARALSDQLTRQTGRPHVVENKTGAGGVIAVQSLQGAPADGSVLLLMPDSTIVIYPHTVTNAGFNALTDLAPVTTVASYDLALSVRADSPIRTLQDLQAAAKADAKGATFASPAAGSQQHFYGLAIGQATGIPLMHVPYRGVAPAVTDTIGGVVTALVTPVGAVLPHTQGGKLRLLATSGAERGSKTRDIPTLKELGYPQLVTRGWFGLFAPGRTSPETVEAINAQVRQAMAAPEFQSRMAALDNDAAWIPAAKFKAQVEAESQQWGRQVQASGFRADK